jgi:F-type H+-transporting ATPase subunit beta
LIVEWDQPGPLIVEVQAHLDENTVRGVALQATAGLKRGVPVRPTGGSITVPVGEPILGRLLDITGRARDNGPALSPTLPRMPIHRRPPPLGERSPASTIFETGIKVIDLLAPLPQGGKAAMFGGAGWQDRRGDGIDPRDGAELSGYLSVRRDRRTLARGS